MLLPHAAADALTLPRGALSLELHCISFSHYCARAKWYLGACGLKLDALHPLLPMQHVPHMIVLLRRFRAPSCGPTASSKSPAATPALAVYKWEEEEEEDGEGAKVAITSNNNKKQKKKTLFLLQDSELIGRWAALRAQALGDGGAAVRALYGSRARLSAVVFEEAKGEAEAKDRLAAVLTYDEDQPNSSTASALAPPPPPTTPAELERRLSGALGVESRRLVYYHLLPARALLARMFSLNAPAGGGQWAAPLWALAASLALPRLLGVDRERVDKGAALLGAEFDFLDALVLERGCLVAGGSEEGAARQEDRVGAFLCGGSAGGFPSVADISLATLAAPLCGDGLIGYGAMLPAEREMPEGLRRALREGYAGRPAARYARALWREYGAAAVAAASAGGGGGGGGPAARL